MSALSPGWKEVYISDSFRQVAEILKDRLSWYRDCRAVDVMNVMSTGNGGTIELLYMQVKTQDPLYLKQGSV